MSRLCPQYFIPSNISTSMQQIQLSIKTAPAQLQKLYRQKETCDVIIKTQDNEEEYRMHKYVLQKNSQIFFKGIVIKKESHWVVQVNQKHKKQLVQKLISLLYGYCISIVRSEIQDGYQLAKSLFIEELMSIIKNDMISHFEDYELFPLMKLAINEQIQEVVALCYEQLEMEMYEPMRYSKSGLFLLDEELFLQILKRHNSQKMANQRFGLSRGQVFELVEEYCFINGIDGPKKAKIITQIQDHDSLKYYVSLNQMLKKQLTPNNRRAKSSSEIFFRNTLSLPRQKQEPKPMSHMIPKIRRLSPVINTKLDHSSKDSLSPTIPFDFSKRQNSQRSFSNLSTDNKSQMNRSRKQSCGSVETMSDPRILITITELFQSQKSIQESHQEIKIKAQELGKRLKEQLNKTKQKTERIRKLEDSLEQIKAEINSSREKLCELTQTVNNVEREQKKIEAAQKFDSLFEREITLELTVSTQFSNKYNSKKYRG